MVTRIRYSFLTLMGLFLLLGLSVPSGVYSEFFRYVDKDGKVHYVDDLSRSPPEYRDDLKVYKEAYDHLSESEKAVLLEKEQQKSDKRRQDLEEQRKAEEKRRIESKQKPKDLTTEVTIKGNHVLVPVTLGYGPKKVQAHFVLDTGAEIVVVHQGVAQNLNIQQFRKGMVKVAGGKQVPVKIVKLSYVQVGPYRKSNIRAVVITPEGSLHYDGLLGMNFLKGLDYKIDFENRVIHWRE